MNLLPEEKYLSVNEVKELLNSIDKIEDKVLLEFAFNTGLRQSDLVTIQTSNFNFERNTAKIWDEKKDIWRLIVFPAAIGNFIKMYISSRPVKSRYLFPGLNVKTHISTKTTQRKIKKWCQKTNIRINDKGKTDVTFHWTRHTFIVQALLNNWPIKLICDNTGDSIETILKYYNRFSIEDKCRIIENNPLYQQNVVKRL